MNAINSKLKEANLVGVDEYNWMVMGKTIDGRGINLGNFKNKEEAIALRDFINISIEKSVDLKAFEYLAEALNSLFNK